jgi:hypothetical protein
MSEMYKELASGYRLDESQKNTTGTRLFVRDDVSGDIAVGSLPVVGTSLMVDYAGSNITGCLCRGSRPYEQDGVKHIEFRYSIVDPDSATGKGGGSYVPNDASSRSFAGAAELIVIEGGKNEWVWENAATPVTQSMSKSIFTGTFTVPVPEMSAAQKALYLDIVKTKAGTINNATFEGFAVGQVLFSGIDGGTYRDADGGLKWSFNAQFQFRIIKDDIWEITQNDWLLVWNIEAGRWDYPRYNVASVWKYLYAKTDFSNLITVPAEPPPP